MARVFVTYAVPVQVLVDTDEGTVERVVTVDEEVHHRGVVDTDEVRPAQLGVRTYYDFADTEGAELTDDLVRKAYEIADKGVWPRWEAGF